MKKKLLLKLAFLYFHLLTNTKLSHSLTPDGLSLLSLKSAVDQTSAGSAFSDWNEDDPTPCRWTGVWCMNITGLPDPHVVGIAISGKNLRGYIPSELGNLIYLRRLNLHNNNFYGSIPDQLFNATSLHGLFLYGNNLSGSLPPSICNPPRLQNLDLSNNSLSGSLPQNLNSCKQLQRLILAKNKFSAPIPAGIWPELDNLVQLDLSDNAFNGSIPNDIVLICEATISAARYLKQGKKWEEGNQKESLWQSTKVSLFELDELLKASAYVLGKSGLGIVYKVVLDNGIPVAVRRLGEGGEQRYKEFVTEAQAIGKVKHPNVVKLRAYYWAPDEKLLISDFISNGNLANALRDVGIVIMTRPTCYDASHSLTLAHPVTHSQYILSPRILPLGRNGQPSSLSWSTRLRIAKGTARGLAYLHECSPRKFVHGDIKPSNILLDNKFQPYISDFGLNRLITITGNNPSSSGGFMGGALPYLKSVQTERPDNYRPPEARVSGNRPTQKWDVYSFGVVLLELLTGKSPELSPSASTSIEVPDLVKWVRKGFEEENPLSDMVDPLLLQEFMPKKR
ncbi:hypothetical protein OIU76_014237 [Salix suchowensis]|nr:hypothetical protein OIU76_014237 [Salix suchowensis]